MKTRPKLNLELSPTDQVLEIIGWFALVALWWLTLMSYAQMPDTIPTHYSLAGEADGYGSKETILTLPLIGTILFVGMTILNRYPHIFNYPTEITAENALKQYTNVTRMIRYLKLTILLVFSLIVFKTFQTATGQADGLGSWFYFALFGLLSIPSAFFVSKLLKSR